MKRAGNQPNRGTAATKKKPRRASATTRAASLQNMPRNMIREVAGRLPITNAYRLFKTSSAAKPGVRNGILKPKIAAFEKLLVARFKKFIYKALRRELLDGTWRRGPRHPARAFNADPKTMTIVNQGGVKVTATWKELSRHWSNQYNPTGLLKSYDLKFVVEVCDETKCIQYNQVMRIQVAPEQDLRILKIERDPLDGIPFWALGLQEGQDPPEAMLGPKLPRLLQAAVRTATKEYNQSRIPVPLNVIIG